MSFSNFRSMLIYQELRYKKKKHLYECVCGWVNETCSNICCSYINTSPFTILVHEKLFIYNRLKLLILGYTFMQFFISVFMIKYQLSGCWFDGWTLTLLGLLSISFAHYLPNEKRYDFSTENYVHCFAYIH